MQRVVDPADGEQLLHEGGVDHRGAVDDPIDVGEEVVDVADAILEQVSAALLRR